MKDPAKLIARARTWRKGFRVGNQMHALADALERQQDEAFYAGVMAALAVIKHHDEETLYREIVNTVDAKELVRCARRDNALEWAGLIRYGYARASRKHA